MFTSRKFLLGIFIATAVTAPIYGQPAAKPTLDSRWADLVSSDDGTATRALLALASTPKETIAFLQEQLKPVKADAKRVELLVKQLESTNFATRTKANAELEYLGKYIKADLEAALKNTTDIETKMRIRQLIDKMPKDKKAEAAKPMPMPKFGGGRNISVSNINGQIRITIDGQVIDLNNLTPPPPPPPPPGPPASWVRAVRAVTLLEHLATPEARALLQTMASGESDALPTAAARGVGAVEEIDMSIKTAAVVVPPPPLSILLPGRRRHGARGPISGDMVGRVAAIVRSPRSARPAPVLRRRDEVPFQLR